MQKKKVRYRWLWIIVVILVIGAGLYFAKNIQFTSKLIPYLPKERVIANQIESKINNNIRDALLNIMHKSDFFISVQVDLVQDELTEEVIEYTPKEVVTNTKAKELVPVKKVNKLPGLVDNPFHNESLPGFPSYFDQFQIKKGDFVTRGLFAKILSIAYQIPKIDNEKEDKPVIIDNKETEFSESIDDIVNADILKLYKTGEYHPNNFLTKASLVAAIIRINYPKLISESDIVISELPYKDIDRNYWAYEHIKIALEQKLINEDVLFGPNEKVTVENVLAMIAKTPLRSDVFNYYKFPRNQNKELFKTKNKNEASQSSIYYNQEKKLIKSPSTKINNISIRVIINENVLDNDFVTIPTIENIVNSVVIIDESRNDSLLIKSYPFTNISIITKIFKWKEWERFNILLVSILVLLFLIYLFIKFLKLIRLYLLRKEKKKIIREEAQEKLAKIYEEKELKSYKKVKEEVVTEAFKNTEVFSLKLEKWLEMLQSQPDMEDNPNEPYEKISIIILFVDFEKPGLSSKIIKNLQNKTIVKTLDSIENISKISVENVQQTIRAFYENFMTSNTIIGGKATTNYIINKSFNDEEKQIILNLETDTRFTFINSVETDKVVNFLLDENDAVSAFILSKCEDEKLIEIAQKLPKEKLKPIIENLLAIKNTFGEFIDQYEDNIKEKLFIKKEDEDVKKPIEIKKASYIFETLPIDIRTTMFTEIENENPELLSQIKSEIFIFEDLQFLPNVDVQSLIFQIMDMNKIALSLYNSSDKLINKFKENFSERFLLQYNNARESLTEDQLVEKFITDAQNEIIRILRSLEKENQIGKLNEVKRSQL